MRSLVEASAIGQARRAVALPDSLLDAWPPAELFCIYLASHERGTPYPKTRESTDQCG
jgi:hypothetical protein